ncbi:hypothetical protein BpHYR1_002006 [Brachionus plicatilis]|uniref:Uncharacterized protein n=1 Tax=Brachionus plicatilis TaxID=10195 RepID=A0A3M7SPD7_BRAPC|nr:hypothetical protein BpHYR1_002006 [Brachionus plicatilis]
MEIESLKSDFPLVNIEKLGNESILLDINWEDFEPNTYGLRAQTFELIVNDKPLYTGQSRQFKQTLSMEACNRLLNESNSVHIRLKSTLNKNIYLAQPVTIPFKCSSTKQSNKRFSGNPVIYIHNIWCVNKYRSSNGEQSFSSSTLSINSSLQKQIKKIYEN